MNIHQLVDYSVLKQTAIVAEIDKACKEAKQHEFASVCVPPLFVKKCKELLKESKINVATVIGFPFGYSPIEAKLAEILLAIVDGADELDMVVNIMAIKNNDWQYVANEINHILPIIKEKKKVIKLIIETGVLTDEEIIKCCQLYGTAGIDFLQTSTGYADIGATIKAVQLMKKNLPTHIQIKASGGINNMTFAKELIEAGATRIGCTEILY